MSPLTPSAEVEVAGSKRTKTVTAILDTGFEGDLFLPTTTAVELELELIGTEVIELADGSDKEELFFQGVVRFLGRKRKVKIFLTSADALIGTDLLQGCRLSLDFSKTPVRVTFNDPKK